MTIPPTPPVLFHDPWLTPRGAGMEALAATIAQRLEDHIRTTPRKPRNDIVAARRTIIENLVCNLAVLLLSPDFMPDRRLAISTKKHRQGRYDRPDFPQGPLAQTLRGLEEIGVLERHAYVFKRSHTTVAPTSFVWDAFEAHRVELAEVGRKPGAETIWLGARDEDGSGRRYYSERRPKKRRDYEDTPTTNLLRSQMATINEALNRHSLRLGGNAQPPVHLVRWFLLRHRDDPPEFNLMGRLAQGWWMVLPKSQRHLISIGGQEIADLDWQAMWAHLLYLRAQLPLPSKDPYAIRGLEQNRTAAKLAFLSMVARDGPLLRLSPALKQKLPEGWDARKVVDAVTSRHRPIAHMFGRDLGVDLMATESSLIVGLMLDLAEKGIPFLPVHDGGMCRRGDRDEVARAMNRVSQRELGVVIPVVEKAIPQPMEKAA